MTRFALLLNLTADGVKAPASAQGLVNSVLETFEQDGGSLEASMWAAGDPDMIAIVDASAEKVHLLETTLERDGLVAVRSVSGVSDDAFAGHVQGRDVQANGDSAKTHAEEAKTHAEGQAKTHADAQAKTHAEAQAKTHAQGGD